MKESMKLSDEFTKGIPVKVRMDHKNNLLTKSVISNKRANKKLLRWSLEIEELGDRYTRE